MSPKLGMSPNQRLWVFRYSAAFPATQEWADRHAGKTFMPSVKFFAIAPLALVACAATQSYDVLADYEEKQSSPMVAAPESKPGSYAPGSRDLVNHGRYMVELLGCGVCHTDGALVGEPDLDRALGGSRTGIAYTNPLEYRYPGVVYPPNITPDEETGIGRWTDQQIKLAVRAGLSTHVGRRITVMPWQGYAKLKTYDVDAIVAYLRTVRPVKHRVPANVEPGTRASEPFVYFGIYQSRDTKR